MLLNELSESFAFDAFHDDVDVFVIVNTLVKLDNIGVVHFKNHIDLLVQHGHHLILIARITIFLAFSTVMVFVN